MQLSKRFLSPNPADGGADPKDVRSDDESINSPDTPLSENHSDDPDAKEHKSFKTSLRDALQDWSNDDARDIEEDDSTPMRSGL